MRILDLRTDGVEDYLQARGKDMSCTFRPSLDFPVEEYVRHYAGPPAYITWHTDDNRNHIGWAIPYTALQMRAEITPDLLNLDNPKLIFSGLPASYSTSTQWTKRLGAKLLLPSDIRPQGGHDNFWKNDIDTLFIGADWASIMMTRNINLLALKRVVIFVGCHILDEATAGTIRAFFSHVQVTLVYWRAWTGIISMVDFATTTHPHDAGMPIAGLTVEERSGSLFVRGVTVNGVALLTCDGCIPYGQEAGVPTLNTGNIQQDRLFVTGHVA